MLIQLKNFYHRESRGATHYTEKKKSLCRLEEPSVHRDSVVKRYVLVNDKFQQLGSRNAAIN
mgnify:CR=1 FL=1